MPLIWKYWRSFHIDNDGLADYRPRIGALISAVGAFLLLPFSVLQWWQERYVLAILFFGISAILSVNAWSLRQGQSPLIPFGPVVLGLIGAVCISVAFQGLNGIFWAYPVLFIGFFVTSRQTANLLGLLLLISVFATVLHFVGPGTATRVLATLLLIYVMINVVLTVVSELQHALIAQAITDPLTGTFNRRHLQDRLNLRTAGHNSQRRTMLMLDIDHFKRINDTFGHDEGDQVLQKVASILQQEKQGDDGVFRMGGEEFLLLLPGKDEQNGLSFAESLRRRIEQELQLPDGRGAVTVSIGVAEQKENQPVDTWLKQADEALYRAKRDGRNRVQAAQAPTRRVG